MFRPKNSDRSGARWFEKIRVREWGDRLKNKIQSNPKLRALAQKIKNHPRVIQGVNRFQALELTERVAILIGVAGLLLFILGPFALLYRKTNLITYEATQRGETLVHLLAAQNQAAFNDQESVLYNVDFVAQERGVKDAVVTDLQGVILFPVARFGKSLDSIKDFGSPKECTRRKKGRELELACPIFKWVEKEKGFVKEPMGMAYLNYSAHESLDLMGPRAFHVFYLLVIFAAVLATVIYLVLTLLQKPIEDLRYNLLAYRRGGTDTLVPPQHFKVLEDLTAEITAALKEQGGTHADSTPVSGDENALIEIARQTALASQKETILIDADKKLIFASDRIREEAKLEVGPHVLKAVKSSPYVNELVEFFSHLLEDKSEELALNLPIVGQMRGMVLKLWGRDYYWVTSL